MSEETPPAGDTADPADDAAKSADHMIPKARLDEEIGKRRALEEEVSGLAKTLLGEVPDNLKALIPENLSPAEQIAWFKKAKEGGAFEQRSKVPTTDHEKPKTTPKDPDLSKLPAHARMAAGYAKKG